jgi:uncharacterized membrane protein YfcA
MLEKKKLILTGFCVALVSAGTGIGGGAMLVPLLVSVFGLDFKKAAGVSLATIIPISFIGAVSHIAFSPDFPDLKYYWSFIPSCGLGTLIGGKIIPKWESRWLKIAFSVFLLMVSLNMLQVMNSPAMFFFGLKDIPWANPWAMIFGVGLFIGIIAVLLGVGCGLLIVPFYVIIIDFPMHQAITLSLSTMFFLSLSATFVQNKLKQLDIDTVRQLFLPALTGALVGVMIASRLPSPVLKKIFGLFLLITACSYLLHELLSNENHLVLFKKQTIKGESA